MIMGKIIMYKNKTLLHLINTYLDKNELSLTDGK